MEISTLIHKLYLDFTRMYFNSKWVFFLFTVYWKKEDIVEISDIQKFRTVYFGLIGSVYKTQMHVQVIVEPRKIKHLVIWLNTLLERADSIVCHVNAWPGNVDLASFSVDNNYLQTFKGREEDIKKDCACNPFLLINEWLVLFLESTDCFFFFCDSFNLYRCRVFNTHLIYSPLFHLKKEKTFIHLKYRSDESQLYYFNCSFSDWWNYRCSLRTVIYHPTVYILNKIAECGLYHVEFEVDDNTQFLEKLIRFGFESIPIECSYTYQSPKLFLRNRINLIVGYKVVEIRDIKVFASNVFSYLQDLNPNQVYRSSSKEIDCLSYPNKVSRSIWTQDFQICKLLCRLYDSEWDELDLDETLLYIKPKIESVSPTTGLLERSVYPEVQKDIDYMRANKRDFISVYRHHDPFTKKQQ